VSFHPLITADVASRRISMGEVHICIPLSSGPSRSASLDRRMTGWADKYCPDCAYSLEAWTNTHSRSSEVQVCVYEALYLPRFCSSSALCEDHLTFPRTLHPFHIHIKAAMIVAESLPESLVDATSLTGRLLWSSLHKAVFFSTVLFVIYVSSCSILTLTTQR
jgi:hypothetical protein